jgi:hypothetical protein
LTQWGATLVINIRENLSLSLGELWGEGGGGGVELVLGAAPGVSRKLEL